MIAELKVIADKHACITCSRSISWKSPHTLANKCAFCNSINWKNVAEDGLKKVSAVSYCFLSPLKIGSQVTIENIDLSVIGLTTYKLDGEFRLLWTLANQKGNCSVLLQNAGLYFFFPDASSFRILNIQLNQAQAGKPLKGLPSENSVRSKFKLLQYEVEGECVFPKDITIYDEIAEVYSSDFSYHLLYLKPGGPSACLSGKQITLSFNKIVNPAIALGK